MNILFTITAYPPSIGGAQFYAYYTMRELASRKAIQVVTQWDEARSDWLLGITVRSPAESKSYVLDGIPICRLGLRRKERLARMPWVMLYYPFRGLALAHIARILATHLEPFIVQRGLIHNTCIGREGLSYASLEFAPQTLTLYYAMQALLAWLGRQHLAPLRAILRSYNNARAILWAFQQFAGRLRKRYT